MPKIRLSLAYDGGAFAGWQVQPDQRTVQQVLEAAILSLTGEVVRVLSAGRTDAGVHALGQVASFETRSTIPAEKFRPALQARLPDDLVILDSVAVPDDFHATYSARRKCYRYVIREALVEDPFLRRYAWRMNGPLDVAAMHAAARSLLGTHDFRCFETDWPNKASSVRTIYSAGVGRLSRGGLWSRESLLAGADGGRHDVELEAAAELIAFEIEGDGFLYNMVRAIVGTLVNVGRGKWPVEVMQRIIAGQDRGLAGETAPAHGLYLVRVDY